MPYTIPKTWTNEPLVASDLNTEVRDNVEALKDPPSAHYELNEGADYTTMSTTFVDVDATPGKLSLTIVTAGGDVFVHFDGVFSGANIKLNVDVDGAPYAADDGIITIEAAVTRDSGGFTRIISGLAAGSHTFKLTWAVFSSTGTLYAGAGSIRDNHPQFWVREVS